MLTECFEKFLHLMTPLTVFLDVLWYLSTHCYMVKFPSYHSTFTLLFDKCVFIIIIFLKNKGLHANIRTLRRSLWVKSEGLKKIILILVAYMFSWQSFCKASGKFMHSARSNLILYSLVHLFLYSFL